MANYRDNDSQWFDREPVQRPDILDTYLSKVLDEYNINKNQDYKKLTTADLITEVCNEIRDFLLDKNRKYGDSAINPIRIFSKASPLEQLKVRLDDKISRIINVQPDDEEDVISDLIGYLILLRVCERAKDL